MATTSKLSFSNFINFLQLKQIRQRYQLAHCENAGRQSGVGLFRQWYERHRMTRNLLWCSTLPCVGILALADVVRRPMFALTRSRLALTALAIVEAPVPQRDALRHEGK